MCSGGINIDIVEVSCLNMEENNSLSLSCKTMVDSLENFKNIQHSISSIESSSILLYFNVIIALIL